MTDTTVIEMKKTRTFGVVALLIINGTPMNSGQERYVIARDYNPIKREWYQGGLYHSDILMAAKCYKREIKE